VLVLAALGDGMQHHLAILLDAVEQHLRAVRAKVRVTVMG